MRKLLMITGGVGFLAFAVFLPLRLHFQQASPQLRVLQSRVDLGEGPPLSTLRGAIDVANPGDARLEFSIRKSCSCLKISPERGSIAPGHRRRLAVTMQLPEKSGAMKKFEVQINSANYPALCGKCVVIGRCAQFARVSPQYLNLGAAVVSRSGPDHQRMATLKVESNALSSLNVAAVAHAGEFFSLDDDSLLSDGTLHVRLKSSALLQPGEYRGVINFTHQHTPGVVSVPIAYRVLPPFEVFPKTVFLERNADGMLAPYDGTLLIHDEQLRTLEPEFTSTSSRFELLALGASKSRVRTFRVSFADLSRDGVLDVRYPGSPHVAQVELKPSW